MSAAQPQSLDDLEVSEIFQTQSRSGDRPAAFEFTSFLYVAPDDAVRGAGLLRARIGMGAEGLEPATELAYHRHPKPAKHRPPLSTAKLHQTNAAPATAAASA